MHIKKHSRSVKLMIIPISLVILSLAAWLVYAQKNDAWPFKTSTTVLIQDEINKASTTDTLNTQEKDTMTESSKSENVDTKKTSDQVPISDNVTVRINTLLQSNNGVVSYEAHASKREAGTCSATFTHDLGKPVIRNNSSKDGVCSANIPAMEFDALGEWTLTLRYYSNNAQAVATQTVRIN